MGIPGVVGINHDIGAKAALAQALRLSHTDPWMASSVFGDLAQLPENLFTAGVAAAFFLTLGVVGADEDLFFKGAMLRLHLWLLFS